MERDDDRGHYPTRETIAGEEHRQSYPPLVQEGEQPMVHGASGDFFDEVNDDMDTADLLLREMMKMWDAGAREEPEKATERSSA